MGISRDEMCAQRIGLIAEMGGMEEDITVTGCCYLEHGQIKYRVSNDKEELYQFLWKSAEIPLFPTPAQDFTMRKLIPAGGKEDILYEVERQLARMMAQQYPEAYFETMRQFIEQPACNEAWPFLQQLQDLLEGHFEEDELQLYEMLLNQCCQKKQVDEVHKHLGWQWLQKNRNQMEDDVVVKEKNERTFYGFVYYQKDGRCRTKTNMELDRVVDAKIDLECDGILTGPILRKTFWYAEAGELPKLREKFEQWLKNLCNEQIQALLEQIGQLPSVVDKQAYMQFLKESAALPPESQKMLQWYKTVWNVK